MKTLIKSTAMVGLLAGAAPAMADCDIGQTTEYTKQDGALAPGARRDLRQLRNAAMMLNTYEQEEACQQVVAAIQEIREKHATEKTQAMKDGEGRQAASEQAEDGARGERDMTASGAKPVSELKSRLTMEKMMEADVRGARGDVIGEITNVVLNEDGKPSHAIVAFGGLLGLGEERVAVPYSQLRMRTSVEDTDDPIFFVPMTSEQLSNAPRVEADDESWLSDDDWVSKNEDYYENNNATKG